MAADPLPRGVVLGFFLVFGNLQGVPVGSTLRLTIMNPMCAALEGSHRMLPPRTKRTELYGRHLVRKTGPQPR